MADTYVHTFLLEGSGYLSVDTVRNEGDFEVEPLGVPFISGFPLALYASVWMCQASWVAILPECFVEAFEMSGLAGLRGAPVFDALPFVIDVVVFGSCW